MSRRLVRWQYLLRHARRGWTFGHCPICEGRTIFAREGDWLRDQFKCSWCYSIPRNRAVLRVLNDYFPDWRSKKIHESSPCGTGSEKIRNECPAYTQTQFYPDLPVGESRDGYRCEDLERQTFPDASFDLVITQDVFEHVLDPAKGFAEVARTLKPGGAHVFTIPWYYWKPTLIRAARNETGELQYFAEKDYHGNPVDPNGSLVVTEWGSDFCDFIYHASGMTTTAVRIVDRKQGIVGEFLEVFISRKAAA